MCLANLEDLSTCCGIFLLMLPFHIHIVQFFFRFLTNKKRATKNVLPAFYHVALLLLKIFNFQYIYHSYVFRFYVKINEQRKHSVHEKYKHS